MTGPQEGRPWRAPADRQSPPAAIDELTGKFEEISVKSGGKPETPTAQRSPASGGLVGSPSPPSDLIIRRGEHTLHRPPAPSLEEREGGSGEKVNGTPDHSTEDREMMRFKMVGRKKNFELLERVKGRTINVLKGLELHTNVFSDAEQKKIVDFVYDLQEKGRRGELRERTYSEPRKWMRGKGRVTIQFGCCYNYAVDKDGNPPGIIRDEEVDPLPPLLKNMIKRMVAWHVLPPTCVPNSCIINLYDKHDCIPPHIDHHDFVRPFCTVSFLSECNILFGTELKVLGPGEFLGSVAVPLPVGSVLILNGNGADVAKHCVPAVPDKRISITFRKMDDSKLPYRFRPDPELHNLRPLELKPPSQQARSPASSTQQQGEQITTPSSTQQQGEQITTPSQVQVQQQAHLTPPSQVHIVHPPGNQNLRSQSREKSGSPFQLAQHDFPPLGSSSSTGRGAKSIRQ